LLYQAACRGLLVGALRRRYPTGCEAPWLLQFLSGARVRWLFGRLDRLGGERVDLHVQRDNPQALAFWQAQGFGTAGCRMRIYPEPESGTVRSSAAAYVGALSSDLK